MSFCKWISIAPIENGCNLSCEYCYIAQHGTRCSAKKNINTYKYSIDYMINALTVERLGGVCMFNFCADGETLLSPNILEIVEGLLRNNHYVSIVTNGTITSAIDSMIMFPKEYLERVVFKCSLHYKELEKRNLLKVFSNNIQKLKKHNIAFSVECVACDYILEDIEEIKNYCLNEFGALPHLLTGRSEKIEGQYSKFETQMSDEEYYKTWTTFDSNLFEYQYYDYEKPCNEYFCHGGEYTGILNLNTGNFSPCPGNSALVSNFFEDITQKIKFVPMAKACPFPYCFMGHVFQGLGGDCGEDYTIPYKFWEFRDRKCADGTYWLSPTIKEAYNHQCIEYHDKLSNEQKYFVNALVKKRYMQKDNETNILILSNIIESSLKNKNIKSIAIYGMGNLGSWLLDLLLPTDIKTVCGLDKKFEYIKSKIPVVAMDGMVESVDAIIISPYYLYTSIAPELRKIYPDVPLISIAEIVQ